jgi:glycosyltransferase involved in cell wall biosynthesis
MRVLFDGFWWVRGPVSNRQVLREFVLAWAQQHPGDELIVAVRHRDREAARADLPAAVTIVGTRLSPQGVSAIAELPFVARRVHADITITHNFTPAFGTSAVFVHDYMFLTSPEWFTLKERAYFSLMPLTARRARWLFTSSRSEADRISGLSGGREVIPIGLAVGSGLAHARPRKPTGLEGIDGRFLLCVGRLNARKNLATTIQAALASGRVTEPTPLLIVGEPQGRHAELPPDVAEAVRCGAVRFLGFIDDDELAWLYGNASALLFLTRDEGFGLPALEALHFGAPLVMSDLPVFRETVGERATFVDPMDVPAIAAAIQALPPRIESLDTTTIGYSWDLSVRRMREAVVARLG